MKIRNIKEFIINLSPNELNVFCELAVRMAKLDTKPGVKYEVKQIKGKNKRNTRRVS